MSTDEKIPVRKTMFDSYATSDIIKSHRVLNTPSEFARENLFYVQEVGYLKSLKSHTSRREHLNSYLFFTVLSGSGQFTYCGRQHTLHANDCIFIDCNRPYSHCSSETDPWELMWVHFNGRQASCYYGFYESILPHAVFHTELQTDFITTLQTVIQLQKINDLRSEFLISKLLTDLLTLCITRNDSASSQESTEKLEQVRDYLDVHFAEKISLDSLAEEFYISKFYLAREFKKYYGVTIGDYLRTRRVTHAKELLRFTDKPIDEIAGLCGIPDSNYFSKMFRKSEGYSASEYRKKW